LFDLESRFFVPTRKGRRAQEWSTLAVAPNMYSALAGHTSTAEHDGTLDAVGMTIRGEPAFGRAYQSRHNLVFGG
jgi:hypothetical protein